MMKNSEPSLLIVALAVVGFHAAAIYWVALRAEPLFFQPIEKRLVVNTVAIRPAKVVESKPVAIKSSTPPKTVVKKPIPQKKPPEVKRPAVVKKEPPKVKRPAVVKKEPPVDKKKQLIANAQEKIAKIRGNLDKSRNSSSSAATSLKDLGIIESLRIDSPDIVAAEDKGYYGILAGRLRERLRLPEYGEVRVLLTLSRAGAVVKVETLGAASEYNKQYIEKMLPTVPFPPFGKNFGSESRHTFTITLTNDA